MDRLKKHEDELNFFALEMQAREVMYGWQGTPGIVAKARRWRRTLKGWQGTLVRTIWLRTLKGWQGIAKVRRWLKIIEGAAIALYGALCNYGRSYLRPICWLLGTILVGALMSWPHFGFDGYHKALGFSFVNTFGLLGLRKDFFAPSFLEQLPMLEEKAPCSGCEHR